MARHASAFHLTSRVILAGVLLAVAEAAEPEAQARVGAGGSREAFLRLLDRPRVPLSPDVHSMTPDDPAVVRERFSLASQQGERVPGVLLKPRGGNHRRPAPSCARTGRRVSAAPLPLTPLARRALDVRLSPAILHTPSRFMWNRSHTGLRVPDAARRANGVRTLFVPSCG